MDFFSRNKNGLSLLFMVLFSVSSMAVQTGVQFSIKGVIAVTISPFQKLYHGTYSTVKQLWAGLTELNYLRDELKQTRKRLENYEAISQNLSEIKRENERLRKLVGFSEKSVFKAIPAEIISKSPDNYFNILIINRGSSDGIKKYMPVVAYQDGKQALVGKVSEVRWNIAKVTPILDSQSQLGALLQKNRSIGLLRGGYPARKNLLMEYISSSSVVEPGEEVITSGQGGLFPMGILIGKVTRIGEHKPGGFRECEVEPHLDFARLDQLLVIKKDLDQELQQILKSDKGLRR